MERKNKTQKKAIVVLLIVIVLLAALIVFLQVRMSNANANARESYDAEIQESNAKIEELQAAYDSATVEGREEVGYDNIIDAMKAESKDKKAQVKDLESQKKALIKAQEEAAAAAEEAPAEEEAPAAEEAPAEEAPAEEPEATEAPSKG